SKQADRVVYVESDTLVALYSLGAASGTDNDRLRAAIRAYASAVVEDEWPRIARQERSPRTDAALNALIREVALPATPKDADVRSVMLDMALKIRAAHEDRIALVDDGTGATKWAAVLLLALITQLAIAVVHLDKPRPQIAALFIFTLGAVSILGLLAIHERSEERRVGKKGRAGCSPV